MNSGKKIVLIAVISLAIAAVYFLPKFTRTGPGLNTQDIKIGILVPLTGDASALGIPLLNAALLAQEEINNAGGWSGHLLELIVEDGKCDPAAAASAAQKLVNVDKVTIIFGGVCSGEALAALPIAQEAGVLMMSPTATSPDLSIVHDLFFRTIASDTGQGAVVADYAYSKLGIRNVALISEQTDYAQGLRKVFKENFSKYGGTVVADEVFRTEDIDMRGQILKIKQSDPDLVYISPQTAVKGELIVKQLRAQDVRATLLASETFVDREAIKKNPQLYKDIIFTEPFFDERASEAIAFLKAYEERFKEKPAFASFSANMYSQFYLLKQGVEAVGVSNDKLSAWLGGIKDWKHALGSLSFNEYGDAVSPYSVKKIQPDGTIRELIILNP